MATKTKTTKKTAEKAETNSIEDAATKAQEQYFSALEQGQEMALNGLETVVDAVSKIQIPAIPGLNSTPRDLPTIKIPTTVVETYFDFAAKALANQREFASKALALTTKS